MTDRFDERARELLAAVAYDNADDEDNEAESIGIIAAALRAEYDRGVLEERERWVAEARERTARLLAADTSVYGVEPGSAGHHYIAGAWKDMAEGVEDFCEAMGVSLDAPDGGEP